MDEQTAATLGQIAQVLSEMIEGAQEDSASNEDMGESGQIFNVTPDGISFQGYSLEEIKELSTTAEQLLSKFNTKERKAGFNV